MPVSILYIGDDRLSSLSRHRADALRRLGCNLVIVNPRSLIADKLSSPLTNFLHNRTGYRLLQRTLLRRLKRHFRHHPCRSDIIWVNDGDLLGGDIVCWLKQYLRSPTILYQNDDPTGSRDGNRFLSLRTALPVYDLCVFVRSETELEALSTGVKRSLRVLMSYDEVNHLSENRFCGLPEPVVSFAGTCSGRGEQRDAFICKLLAAGLPMSLTGNRWKRSPYWESLRHIYRGPAVSGYAYADLIASTAISLGMLNKGNRDLVTTRSLEIPACSGLFCAERTSEHQLLYEDGHEAIFWDTLEDCIRKCQFLLSNPEVGQKIRSAGHLHVQRLGVGNEDICKMILNSV